MDTYDKYQVFEKNCMDKKMDIAQPRISIIDKTSMKIQFACGCTITQHIHIKQRFKESDRSFINKAFYVELCASHLP